MAALRAWDAREAEAALHELDEALRQLLRARGLLLGLGDEGPELGLLVAALAAYEPRNTGGDEDQTDGTRLNALQLVWAASLATTLHHLLGNACAACKRKLTAADFPTARPDPLGAGRVCGDPACLHARRTARGALP
jgi:hypothetical protein